MKAHDSLKKLFYERRKNKMRHLIIMLLNALFLERI